LSSWAAPATRHSSSRSSPAAPTPTTNGASFRGASGRVGSVVHQVIGERPELLGCALAVERISVGEGGLVPDSFGDKESLGMTGAELLIEVKQGPDRCVLVVVAIRPGQVSVQVGGEDVGIFGLGEAAECEAVALAGVDEFAFEQEVANGLPELGSLVQADEPCGGRPGPPFEFEKRAEIGVADLASVLGQCRGSGLRAGATDHRQHAGGTSHDEMLCPAVLYWPTVRSEGGPETVGYLWEDGVAGSSPVSRPSGRL
jgi:hypothetical protein